MINNHDEINLRRIVREMNIGFSAPQNGGVDGSSIVILKGQDMRDQADQSGENEDNDRQDIQQALGAAIENLNHVLRDLEQGCQGDAQIEALQGINDTIASAIEEIGNNVSGGNGSAFSGMNEDPQANEQPGTEAMGMMDLAG